MRGRVHTHTHAHTHTQRRMERRRRERRKKEDWAGRLEVESFTSYQYRVEYMYKVMMYMNCEECSYCVALSVNSTQIIRNRRRLSSSLRSPRRSLRDSFLDSRSRKNREESAGSFLNEPQASGSFYSYLSPGDDSETQGSCSALPIRLLTLFLYSSRLLYIPLYHLLLVVVFWTPLNSNVVHL